MGMDHVQATVVIGGNISRHQVQIMFFQYAENGGQQPCLSWWTQADLCIIPTRIHHYIRWKPRLKASWRIGDLKRVRRGCGHWQVLWWWSLISQIWFSWTQCCYLWRRDNWLFIINSSSTLELFKPLFLKRLEGLLKGFNIFYSFINNGGLICLHTVTIYLNEKCCHHGHQNWTLTCSNQYESNFSYTAIKCKIILNLKAIRTNCRTNKLRTFKILTEVTSNINYAEE